MLNIIFDAYLLDIESWNWDTSLLVMINYFPTFLLYSIDRFGHILLKG